MMKTNLKARYRLSDLFWAQRNDRMTSDLKRLIENGAINKNYLEEDSYKILKQFHMQKKTCYTWMKTGLWSASVEKKLKTLTNTIR